MAKRIDSYTGTNRSIMTLVVTLSDAGLADYVANSK